MKTTQESREIQADVEGIAASFICADAQVHAFEPVSFDMIISRFGVMFFDDPRPYGVPQRTTLNSDSSLGGVWRKIRS